MMQVVAGNGSFPGVDLLQNERGEESGNDSSLRYVQKNKEAYLRVIAARSMEIVMIFVDINTEVLYEQVRVVSGRQRKKGLVY